MRFSMSKLFTIMTAMILAAMFFFSTGGPATASDSESPLEIIKSRNRVVEGILDGKGDDVDQATKEKLKDVINGLMDFNELSRIALGKHWKDRTEQERQDFVEVFEQLIRNSSVKKLEIYQADRMDYEEPVFNDTKAKVTTVAHKGRKQVEIIYKMHQVNGEWKCYDMEIDGASTARNYRDSFYKQIAKTSYEEMYQKLVRRLAEQE